MIAAAALPTVRREAGAIADYEDLRRAVLQRRTAGTQSHALALFLRQGMLAWMAAFSPCRGGRPVACPERAGMARSGVLAGDACPQVVRLLTEMVLGDERRGGG